LSDPAVVKQLLDKAGFRNIRVNHKIVTTSMTEAELERQVQFSTTVTGLREVLDELTSSTRQQAVDAIRRDLWARLRDGRIQLRAGVVLTAAQR
jgi:hypothetical protein